MVKLFVERTAQRVTGLSAREQRRSSPCRDPGGPSTAQSGADGSRLVAAQRRRIDDAFGDAARKPISDEEEAPALPLQSKSMEGYPVQRHEAGPGVAGERPNRTGLPNGLKSGVERLSGVSLDGVRVHYDSPKPAELDARAYTQGADIHVAPGQERHLAHEAWHVVQQAQGRVAETTRVADRGINDSPALEAEADTMGERALRWR